MGLTSEQKKTVLDSLKEVGILSAAAKAANITKEQLNKEVKHSKIFKKRVQEAKQVGKQNIADNALDVITSYAYGIPGKTDRNKLTAAIALANAFEPGFKGTQRVEGQIEHQYRIISAVPRPQYIPKNKRGVISPEDKQTLKLLNAGTPAIIKDKLKEAVP